jgi:transposase
MIKKDKHTYADGSVKTQLRVVEGYRPYPGAKTKQRTIRDFGCIEDQPDPDALMKEAAEFNANYREQNVPLRIEAAGTARMYSPENRRMNYGYKFLEVAYDSLGIDDFVDVYLKRKRFKGTYSPAEIFKFLVLMRILFPDSKRASCQMKNGFYGMKTDFTLEDVYRSLDQCADFETELQRHLNEKIKVTVGRDLSYAFFDVTNYFFHIDFPDGEDDLRKKGVSKEHRTDPIVAMGLFMDSNGLPVSMSMFPGNTSDTKTLQPVMKDVKDSYGLGRLIVVADKGLNSSKNIDAICAKDDGFVFSQILKGKKGKRYHTQMFDESGYISNKDESYKYKLFEEEYTGYDQDGKKESRKRKVLIYWDKADAEMARRKREEKLLKAQRAIDNNTQGIRKGVDEYIKEDIVELVNGEVLEKTRKIKTVDQEKANADAKFDGFFCIITSEMEYGEREIRKAYSGLWRIEESFRILKSDLYARPVFVSKNEHIRAHFLICFVALLVVRLIQLKMGEDALSAERIARAMRAANCHLFKGGIIYLDDVGGAIAFKKTKDKNGKTVDTLEFSDEDEIALDYKVIQDTFGTELYNVYHRQEVFNKLFKDIAF